MMIQLPLPLTLTAKVSTENSPPIRHLRDHLQAQGRSLIACLDFVADDAGTAAGYSLIEEARRATAWTRAIDSRVERVRAFLMLEHLDSDEDAIPAPALFDDLDGEAVHACCRHADFLAELRASAARDELNRPQTQPIPLRPPMRQTLPPFAASAPRGTAGTAATAAQVARPPANQRAV